MGRHLCTGMAMTCIARVRVRLLRGGVCTLPGALGQHRALGIGNERQEHTVFLQNALDELP